MGVNMDGWGDMGECLKGKKEAGDVAIKGYGLLVQEYAKFLEWLHDRYYFMSVDYANKVEEKIIWENKIKEQQKLIDDIFLLVYRPNLEHLKDGEIEIEIEKAKTLKEKAEQSLKEIEFNPFIAPPLIIHYQK